MAIASIVARGAAVPGTRTRRSSGPGRDGASPDRIDASDRIRQLAAVAHAADRWSRVAEQRRLVDRVAVSQDRGAILPAPLADGIERLSGVSMAGVQVHRNSPLPGDIGAHAYAQDDRIHLAPGQERHLPHEAWHVAQQRQGRVPVTGRLASGQAVNADPALEAEADRMGSLAARHAPSAPGAAASCPALPIASAASVVQGKFGFELEMRILVSKAGEENEAAADADDRAESGFHDPGSDPIHEGDAFDVVVDHGNGISEWVQKSGHSRRANTAILEIVTHPVDEFLSTEDEAARPMEEAAAFAGRLETLTSRFAIRTPLVAAPVDRPDIFVGQRLLGQETVWQTTTAHVQATYAVKPQSVAGLEGLLKDDGPLGADQFQGFVNQRTALTEAIGKSNAIMMALPKLFPGGDLPEGALTSESLRGLMILAGTYLSGGRSASAEVLDKNMVPLLFRHELTEAHALLDEGARTFLSDAARCKTLRDAILRLHGRKADERLFPARSETKGGVTQPLCAVWLDAVLTGAGAPLQGWFGKSKAVAPEAVGPDGDDRAMGAVVEQRSVRSPLTTIDGVPRGDWGDLARRYYHLLRDLNG